MIIERIKRRIEPNMCIIDFTEIVDYNLNNYLKE